VPPPRSYTGRVMRGDEGRGLGVGASLGVGVGQREAGSCRCGDRPDQDAHGTAAGVGPRPAISAPAAPGPPRRRTRDGALLLVAAVRQRGGGGLVDDAQHVQAGDAAGVLGCLRVEKGARGGSGEGPGVVPWCGVVVVGGRGGAYGWVGACISVWVCGCVWVCVGVCGCVWVCVCGWMGSRLRLQLLQCCQASGAPMLKKGGCYRPPALPCAACS
jgi:hypothetical protein